MSFGVTSTGFNRKRVADIRPELVEDFQEIFGADIDTDSTSNIGAIIDMLTRKFAALWEGLEASYNSRDVNSAEDVSLDRLCAEVGVYREAASSTSVQCTLFGDDGTTIAAEKRVSQDTTFEEFLLGEEVEISALDCISSYFEIDTAIDSTNYTVTIDSVDYTIDSGTSATIESIMVALKIAVDADGLAITFTDNLDGSALLAATDGITAYAIAVDTSMTLGQLSVIGQFSAENTGVIPVPVGTINTIVSSVSGWDSVSNMQAGVSGSEEETNEELRIRRVIALLGVGSGTDPAIEANISNEVENVTSAKVISNRTSATVDSRPAKSYELIVTGGTDLDVAEKLWEIQPSGIESYGNTSQEITDSNGDTQTLLFSRPADIILWIRYTLVLYSEEELTSNPETTLKDAVVSFASEEYTAGKDVLIDRLKKPLYDSLTGISGSTIEIAVTALATDTPTYGTSDISIADREKASVIFGRITVIIP